VDARTLLSEEIEKDLKNLFFLNRVKEDYINSKDPQVQAYRASFATNQKAKQIFEEYMQLIQLEMLLAKFRLEQNEDHVQEANVYRLEGLKLLSLMKKEKGISHFIEMRLKEKETLFD
jgi:hypothetical protein